MSDKWIELFAQVPSDAAEAAASLLIDSGASAVERREGTSGTQVLVTHFPFGQGAAEGVRKAEQILSRIGVPSSAVTVRLIENQDWVNISRGQFKGEAYGERLWIRPPWEEASPPEGRVEIVLEPGQAFGTGRHSTTRLCLESLERMCADAAPRRVLDVGCGSGILAVAALRLGAEAALGLDLDPDAVEAARALAEGNGLQERMRFEIGTLDHDTLGEWWGRVDLLLANIFLGPLRELAPRMHAALCAGGRGVLSGIGYEQREALERAVSQAGFQVTRACALDEWTAIEVIKI
ncbi:MAG: 50S ribosomal protein L11 methyltransferase [bacterium]|nr:50S ribosomal protein L11 methyltransferase [bacterium]